MQRTFGESFGLDPVVPSRRHRDDEVVCSDGTTIADRDAWFDIDDKAHRTKEERHTANVEIVRDILKAHEQWCDDYTSSDDYGDGYAYIASEVSHSWNDHIDDWLNDQAPELATSDFAKELVDNMANDIDDWECIYHCNEYAGYYGDGICLFSMEVGEYEDQIELSADDRLSVLHEAGELEDILAQLDGEFCLYRYSKYVEGTNGNGRRIYQDYIQRDNFTVTFNPGGQWQYVVPKDDALRLLAEAVCQVCRRLDRRLGA